MIKWGQDGFLSLMGSSINNAIYLYANSKITGTWYLACFEKDGMELCTSVCIDGFDTDGSKLKIIGVDLI